MADFDYKALMSDALAEIEQLKQKLQETQQSAKEPIAIIGMGCRFPGHVNSLDDYWQLLSEGRDGITELTDQRWLQSDFFDEDTSAPGKMHVSRMGLLDNIEEFDAELFGIAPVEAQSIDPQQRVFLETAWCALEHAGYPLDALSGSNTGIVLGLAGCDYAHLQSSSGQVDLLTPYDGIGNAGAAATGRLSYLLGLQGPAYTVDTACSSSLVAVHNACQSLRQRDSDMMIAGAVILNLTPANSIIFAKAGMLSEDGLCKTFDAGANGYVRAEGCGAVVLKRLSDAIRDNDPILAVLRGTAVNQDGRSQGLTAPNERAQEKVIRAALANGGVSPEQVSYVECHGTGTSLGDPIEVGALGSVYGGVRSESDPLLIGSAKTNLGHMETAAGMGGLIKVVLSMQKGELPAHINYSTPNPHIPWQDLPISVTQSQMPWCGNGSTDQLIAGVSSFGFGGTNAHIILQNAPNLSTGEVVNQEVQRQHHLVPLSAKSPAALAALVQEYLQLLNSVNKEAPLSLSDIAYGTQVSRSHFPHRLSLVAESLAEMQTALEVASTQSRSPLYRQEKVEKKAGKLAFLFSGQGAQYAGMAEQLYKTESVFRGFIEEAEEALRPYLAQPLFEIMWGEQSDLLNQTEYTQPCLFALEYALAKLWQHWGIEASYLLGHSVGEYAAACLAGVFSLEDAARLICARGALMKELTTPGDMVAVNLSRQQVAPYLNSYDQLVSIAALNGPSSVVIAGEKAAVAQIVESLAADGVRHKALEVSHAFHSPLMQPMLGAFAEVASSITYHAPKIKIASTLTGQWIQKDMQSADYWVQHVASPVNFLGAVEVLATQKLGGLLEIGPNATLISLVQNVFSADGVGNTLDSEAIYLGSLRKGKTDSEYLTKTLAELYLKGHPIDWGNVQGEKRRFDFDLPNYPFQRKRFWLEHIPLGRGLDDKERSRTDWLYKVDWQALVKPEETLPHKGNKPWILVANTKQAVADAVAVLGEENKLAHVQVLNSDHWEQEGDNSFSLDASNESHIEKLLYKLPGDFSDYEGVFYCADAANLASNIDSTLILEYQERTVGGLLNLVQSISNQTGIEMPKLVVVTDNRREDFASVLHSPLISFASVLAGEFPESHCQRIELNVGSSIADVFTIQQQLSQENWVKCNANEMLGARLLDQDKEKQEACSEISIGSEGTYLITGGLGGLGLEFAQWLVDQGAKHLVLTGRSGAKTDYQLKRIEELKASGAQVKVACLDVAEAEKVNDLVAEIQVSPNPLTGVIHGAGVLDDGVISQQSWQRFEKVMTPKIAGSWNLHKATEACDLDFFAMFSSVAALLGLPGQSNYAAANGFLDRLAQYRQAKGLPATAINWGPWKETGMVAKENVLKRLDRAKGIGTISVAQGVDLFSRAVASGNPQVAVVPFHWQQIAGVVSMMGQIPSLLSQQLRDKAGAIIESLGLGEDSESQGELVEALEGIPANERAKVIINYAREQVAQVLGLDDYSVIELQQPLHELGLDSLMAVEIRNLLARGSEQSLPVSLLFDYPNLEAIANYLNELIPESQEETSFEDALSEASEEAGSRNVDTSSPIESSENTSNKAMNTDALQPAKSESEAIETEEQTLYPDAIAIVGMSCRFPGHSNTPAEYWDLLREGIDAVVDLGDKRWSLEEFYDPDPQAPGKVYVRSAGLIDDIDLFDNDFFGIAPIEATSMDPQQRLLLETSWEAIEYAGYSPAEFSGCNGGVFVGAGPNDYGQQAMTVMDPTRINAYLGTGNALSIAAGRISYVLGWQGPCAAVDTACSSSLVSIHMASQSLNSGECDIALAGGVNITLSPLTNMTLSRAQMLSPDERCKTFDASANGYVRSEGCGIVLLKRLSDAVKDNDNIIAIVRGTAINQDGRSQGLTAPNGLAQEAVIRKALSNASVDPSEVQYCEAHGTGTALGDPIEMRSINAVYGEAEGRSEALKVGSVKTNLGHTEVAAGVAGLIKIALSMQNEQIPPHLHLQEVSPHLQFNPNNIEIPTTLTPWQGGVSQSRLAAVSSFGFSGSNSHAIVEQPKPRARTINQDERSHELFVLSGKTPEALQAQVHQLAQFIANDKSATAGDIADIAFTLTRGRNHFYERAAFVAANAQELIEKLNGFNAPAKLDLHKGKEAVFLFSGQGAQYAGMGKALYESYAPFRESIDTCERLLEGQLSLPLTSVLWGESSEQLNQTEYTQPALFALEYALAQLWRSWGVMPKLVMGHSVGEFAAACIAGAFSLQDGLKLTAARGRLMQQLPAGGAMLSLLTEEAEANKLLADFSNIDVAAYNGPSQVVVAGAQQDLESLADACKQHGIQTRFLTVSHAFHSYLMEPMLAEFKTVLESVEFKTPRIGVVSNLDGRIVKKELTQVQYWLDHVRRPVRFAAGMKKLASEGIAAIIEIGPKPVLLGMGKLCLPDLQALWLPSLRQGQPDWQQLQTSMGELYRHGFDLDWAGYENAYQRNRVQLPTYPFQRKSHWLGGNKKKSLGGLTRYEFAMLGSQLKLPGMQQIRYQSLYSEESPAYIADHKLFGAVVVPGASHIALMLAAARDALKLDRIELDDVCFLQPLVIQGEEERTVQLIMTPHDELYQAELMSIPVEADANDLDNWTVHATGNIRKAADFVDKTHVIDIDNLAQSWESTLPGVEFYQLFSDVGYNLGEAFQWLGDGWFEGATAVRELRWPNLPDKVKQYALYPGLVDALFQSLASCRPDGREEEMAFIKEGGQDEIYIPFALENFRLYRTPEAGEKLHFHSQLRAQENKDFETQTGDIELVDEQGRVVAAVTAIETRKASRSALQQGLQKDITDEWFYQTTWQAKPNENTIATDVENVWVVLVDGQTELSLDHASHTGSLAQSILQQLHYHGQKLVLVEANAKGSNVQPIFSGLDLLQFCTVSDWGDAQFAETVAQLLSKHKPAGIINLAGAGDAREQWSEIQCSLESNLELIKAVAKAELTQPPVLWLASLNGIAVESGSKDERVATNPNQSALWGMVRCAKLEHPELILKVVDFASGLERHAMNLQAMKLVNELLASDGEDQIALREGVRYVARLDQSAPISIADSEAKSSELDQGYFIDVSPDGVLDNLQKLPLVEQDLGDNEIRIDVKATALNYRDVINALGMFQEFAEKAGLPIPERLPLGFDTAGRVAAVGSAVTNFKVGDPVFAACMGGLGTQVDVHESFAVRKPEVLSYAEAASIPTVFITAYYGLKTLANIKAGDKVLIHAAAGGVGLAAIQVANMVGAEVYATASPGKWPYLKSLGVKHLYNSRTLDFASEIKQVTNGGGVDIVLNSINGDCIPKSLDLLSANGRFVEIGKLEVWSEVQIKAQRADVDYFLFDLTETIAHQPKLFTSIMEEVAADYLAEKLEPLPVQCFTEHDVSSGFRQLAQARNIGKVVVCFEDKDQSKQTPISVREGGSYLITGGMGGLGIEVARLFAEQGAGTLLLTGRRTPNRDVQNTIRDIQGKNGARVEAISLDLSDAEAVQTFLQTDVASELSGVVHCAGVLDDGMVSQQNWQRTETVLEPKAYGAHYLHQYLNNEKLDFFINFSSIASSIGSPGQSNYAAANGYLDGFAAYRNQLGYPTLTINWGPWAEVGMAARDKAEGRFSKATGIDSMLPEKAIEAMNKAMAAGNENVSIAAIEWEPLLAQLGLSEPPPYLSQIRIKKGTTGQGDLQLLTEKLRGELDEALPNERQQILIDILCEQIARVMGFDDPNGINPQQPLQEIGLDSLMAVELRNIVNGFLGRALPATLLFKYPTLEELSEFLVEEMYGATEEQDNAAAEEESAPSLSLDDFIQPKPSADAVVVEANLDELSDDEAAALLAKKLAALKGES